MKKRYHFKVGGRVQGVGFRQATYQQAIRLGLDGWVRNRTDGRVEGYAAGDASALARFHAFLKRGPPAAIVEEVGWEPADAEADPRGFEIRRGG